MSELFLINMEICLNVGQFIQGKKIEKVLKAGARYLPYPNSRRGAHMYIKHGGVERLMSDITAIKSVSSNIHTVSTVSIQSTFVRCYMYTL